MCHLPQVVSCTLAESPLFLDRHSVTAWSWSVDLISAILFGSLIYPFACSDHHPRPAIPKGGRILEKIEIVFTKYRVLTAVDTKLVDRDGKPFDTTRVHSLCRCGESNFKPLCDGSHAQAGLVGQREDSNKPALEYFESREITIVYDRFLCRGAGYCGELEAVFGCRGNMDVPIGQTGGRV